MSVPYHKEPQRRLTLLADDPPPDPMSPPPGYEDDDLAFQLLDDDPAAPPHEAVDEGATALAEFEAWGVEQRSQAAAYLAQLRSGKNLRVPWAALDRLVGPILPGWLMFIGARPKAGKTTMLLNLFEAWSSLGKRCLYLGTETGVAALRIQWACLRLGLDLDAYLEGDLTPHEVKAVDEDLVKQVRVPRVAQHALFREVRESTIADIEHLVARAVAAGVQVVLLDYLQRIEGTASQEDYGRVSEVCKRLKNLAERHQIVIVCAAQLNMGSGLLAEFEVPGNGSWYMGKRPQQEGDINLQQWRPFKKGMTTELKRAAESGDIPTTDITQLGVMGVRCSAHRWKPSAVNQITRLRIERGLITDTIEGA